MSYAGLLNQTITLKTKTGLDRHGRETVSAGTSYPARFQRKRKNIIGPDGNIVAIDAVVFVKASVTVSNDDEVIYDGDTYKIVGRRDSVGANGAIHHQTLELIRWQR